MGKFFDQSFLPHPLALLWMALALGFVALVLVLVLIRLRSERRNLERSAAQIGERLARLSDREQSERERDLIRQRLVGAMSHDLRQPIQAMNLYLRRLEQSLSSGWLPDGEREAAHQARLGLRQGLSYMTGLLDGVMDVSQLVQGSLAIRAEPVSLVSLLQGLYAEQSPLFADSGGALELRISDPDLAWVRSDRRLLERLVRNLLANALRYAPACRVRLRVLRSGSFLRLSISDTGPGMGNPQLARIRAELQRRPTGETVPSLQGIGLGLVISRQIAMRIGARLVVSSHRKLGTGFLVVLPASVNPGLLAALDPSDPQSLDDVATDARAALSGAKRPRLVVIVSPIPESRHALSVALMVDGLETLAYTSGSEALAALADLGLRPDFLLIENTSDGSSWWEIAERFEEEFNDWIPAIILTDQALQGGPQAGTPRWTRMLRQPFESAELLALLASKINEVR
jgi:signal transduction histidine kinase